MTSKEEDILKTLINKIDNLEKKLNTYNKPKKTKVQKAPNRFFFIDTENVSAYGLVGLETLTKYDSVYIFSGNNFSEKINKFIEKYKTKAKIEIICANSERKNGLDLHLTCSFSNLLSHKRKGEFYIISKDNGYLTSLYILNELNTYKEIILGKATNLLLENKFVVSNNKLEENSFITLRKQTSLVTLESYQDIKSENVSNKNKEISLPKDNDFIEKKLIELNIKKDEVPKLKNIINQANWIQVHQKLKQFDPEHIHSNTRKLKNLYVVNKVFKKSQESFFYELSSKLTLIIDPNQAVKVLNLFKNSVDKDSFYNSLISIYKKEETRNKIYNILKDYYK